MDVFPFLRIKLDHWLDPMYRWLTSVNGNGWKGGGNPLVGMFSLHGSSPVGLVWYINILLVIIRPGSSEDSEGRLSSFLYLYIAYLFSSFSHCR